MSYLAFYRTFRPTTFDDVVRQEHIVRILKNRISSGNIGHAYLFCGPRGTGKTSLAKIFAKAINCENPVNCSPCGKCPTCKALASGSNLDVTEIDAASNNGVDEMRDLREKVQYPPVAGRYKVYIIDEVHMLTASAFNAVLKTLEEPPRHAVFILATTEPQKIPATILSRCMRFDFKLIPQKDLEGLVKSVFDKTGKAYEPEAVSAIARAGAGSARDSLSIADMCASYTTGKLTYQDVNAVLGSADFIKISHICENILRENSAEALSAVEEILSTGKSVGVLVKDMLSFFNNCTIVKVCRNAREILNLPEETYKSVESAAAVCDGHKLLRVGEILSKAENDLRYSTNGRITLETAVFKCSAPAMDYNLDALIGKIAALEKRLEEVTASGAERVPVVSTAKPAAEERQTSVKQVAAPPVAENSKKPAVQEESGGSPFEKSPFEEEQKASEKLFKAEQPVLWEQNETAFAPPSALSEEEKRTVFGKFVRALRTTRRNAVLFTLCMDLGNFFEGDKLVLTTDSGAVFKALNRTDNAKFVGDVLSELGVISYEVRFKEKGLSDFDKALGELKKNFDGVDIEIK